MSESEVRELESQLIDMSDQLGEARAVVTDLQDEVTRYEAHSRALEQVCTSQASRITDLRAVVESLNSAIRDQEESAKRAKQQIEHAIRLLDEVAYDDYNQNQLSAAIDILKGACGQ